MKRSMYKQLNPFAKVAIYLGGNYGLVFLAQFIGPWGEMPVNIVLCVAVILFTKWIVSLDGEMLDPIGWRPLARRHWKQLLAGIITGMLMLVSTALITKWQINFKWVSTPLNLLAILQVAITVFASAYVQELAFRGYPFQLLLNKYGVLTAQLVIAVLFGCMHLQSNMNIKDILSVMFSTGMGSLLFGLAYIKTKNLALPTGIHFGWNFLQVLIPRHPSQNGHGLVKIADGTFDISGINIFTWIMPYTLILIFVGTVLFFWKTTSSKSQLPQVPGNS